MRRQRHRQYDNEDDKYINTNIISIDEFKYYNKKHQVIDNSIIEEYENKLEDNIPLFWSNNTFAENKIGFKFYMSNNKKTIEIIELKIPFTAEQFINVKTIYDGILFLNFYPTDLEKNILNKFEFITNNILIPNTNEIITFDNFQDVKNMIIKTHNFRNIEYDNDSYQILKTFIQNFFNIEIEKKEYINISKCSWSTKYMHYIENVIEHRLDNINYRFAIVASAIRYGNIEYTIKKYVETDINYNYIDKDRRYIISSGNNFYIDANLNEIKDNKIILDRNLAELMENSIYKIMTKNQKIISQNIYNFYNEKAKKVSTDKNDDDVYDNPLEAKILEKYKERLKNNGEIKLNGITLTKNKIELDNGNFYIEFNKNFLDLMYKLKPIRNMMQDNNIIYNFNLLYEKILEKSSLYIIKTNNAREEEYKKYEGCEFKVNDINIKIEKINNRIKINNIFSRIDDAYHVLTKAICYNTQKDYDRYLKDVSKIGITWKQLLSSGIHLKLKNPMFSLFSKNNFKKIEETIQLRFSLLWDKTNKSQIYLLINGNKHLIKYKGKFKQKFNYPSRIITADKLKNELNECFDKPLENNEIYSIIEDSIAEYALVKEKATKLVNDTIIDTNAVEIEYEINNMKIKGYELKGNRTNSKFFIDRNYLTVYKWDNGAWNRRCVVSDGEKDRIFEDKLANRLINIYNEPKRINTI